MAKLKLFYVALFLLLFTANIATAQDVVGKWWNQEKTSQVQIYKSGEKYYGAIAWIKDPNDEKGVPKTDIFNPRESERTKPLMRLVILRDFVKENDTFWSGGKIYDPRDGKTYSCNMTLKGNELDLRGFIGFSFIGKTNTWTRVGPGE
ncbi:MAG: DUF2147 domain-containing protein [Rhizobacter sp.]|nr:DUF2147 domain-containing protein [Chlorobiales bacterium]